MKDVTFHESFTPAGAGVSEKHNNGERTDDAIAHLYVRCTAWTR